MAQEFDAVVVGGGFSGLYAAALLSQKSRRVCVLESGPNLGGRAFSYRDPRTGDEVDNGQHALLGAYAATRRFLSPVGALASGRFLPNLSIAFRAGGAIAPFSAPQLPAPLPFSAC